MLEQKSAVSQLTGISPSRLCEVEIGRCQPSPEPPQGILKVIADEDDDRIFPIGVEDAWVSAALWALSSVLFEIAQTSNESSAGEEKNEAYIDSHLGEESE